MQRSRPPAGSTSDDNVETVYLAVHTLVTGRETLQISSPPQIQQASCTTCSPSRVHRESVSRVDNSGKCPAVVSNLHLACIACIACIVVSHSSIPYSLFSPRNSPAYSTGAPAHDGRAHGGVSRTTRHIFSRLRVSLPPFLELCTMCSLRRVCFGRRAARQALSATRGENISIGTTCSAAQRSGCNGHVRLKGGRIARIRAVRRQMAIDAEGRAVWLYKTVVGRAV